MFTESHNNPENMIQLTILFLANQGNNRVLFALCQVELHGRDR